MRVRQLEADDLRLSQSKTRTSDSPARRPKKGRQPYRRRADRGEEWSHEEATADHRARPRRVAPRALRHRVRDWRQVIPLAVAVPLALLPFVSLAGALRWMSSF
jgi:hypothetical protein